VQELSSKPINDAQRKILKNKEEAEDLEYKQDQQRGYDNQHERFTESPYVEEKTEKRAKKQARKFKLRSKQ
jgi:hypothetical protein